MSIARNSLSSPPQLSGFPTTAKCFCWQCALHPHGFFFFFWHTTVTDQCGVRAHVARYFGKITVFIFGSALRMQNQNSFLRMITSCKVRRQAADYKGRNNMAVNWQINTTWSLKDCWTFLKNKTTPQQKTQAMKRPLWVLGLFTQLSKKYCICMQCN